MLSVPVQSFPIYFFVQRHQVLVICYCLFYLFVL